MLLAMNLEMMTSELMVRFNSEIYQTVNYHNLCYKTAFSPVVAMPDVRNLFKVLAVIFAKVSWC